MSAGTSLVVIDETRTHLRLAARTLHSLTREGVIQEIYALLLAHLVVRTLMHLAAEQAHISPTQISFDLHHPHHG